MTPTAGCLRSGISRFNCFILLLLLFFFFFAPDFCESSCLFYLRFNFDFYVSKIIHLGTRNLPRKPNN